MKKTLFIITCFCLPLWVQSQTSSEAESKIISNLAAQVLSFPQEKLYLQTDRPYYIAGEKIFFRAFLLHASFNRSLFNSRYVYVELINPANEVVLRQQIRIEENKMFYGALSLTGDLPEGHYQIRAYTRYMENTGEESFFRRGVFIAHPNTSKTEPETTFDFTGRNKVRIGIRFKDRKTGNIRHPEEIEMETVNSSKRISVKSDPDAWFYRTIDLKDAETRRSLLVSYPDGVNSFSKFIYIPYPDAQPEISFFPEGGSLVAGQNNRIAFKALLPDGSAAPVAGSVFNSKGEWQANFTTAHEGMGDFYLKTQAGESYYAQMEYKGQIIKTILPQASTDVFALEVHRQGEDLSVSVRKEKEVPASKVYLLIHNQGVPAFFEEWNFTENRKQINKQTLKPGVSHLMLLDEKFDVLSERLFFKRPENNPKVKIQSNKEKYKSRELIKLDVEFLGLEQDTVPATFAISVTDDKDVKPDTTTNILAEILLTSELKGKINNPAWYFGEGDEVSQAADLLMLTHGWRNYHIREALQGNIQLVKIRPEMSQSITGVLKTPRGTPADYGIIQMTGIGYDFSEAIEADKDGRYYFTDFEFPDSTAFQLIANNKKRKPEVEIYPDKAVYPPVTVPWKPETEKIEDKTKTEAFIDYILKSDKKYVLENGTRMIGLQEVTVTGTQKKKRTRIDNRTSILEEPTHWISPEELEDEPLFTFNDLLRRMTGTCENFGVIVNGIFKNLPNKSMENLESIVHPSDVAQVEYVNNRVAILGYTSSNKIDCLIVITTWPPGYQSSKKKEDKHLINVLPLGYQKPVEFYSPRYDTELALKDPTPDLRTCIYWKPNGIASWEKKTQVEFYSADAKTTYSVVIEGIGNKRQLIYCKADALIEVE